MYCLLLVLTLSRHAYVQVPLAYMYMIYFCSVVTAIVVNKVALGCISTLLHLDSPKIKGVYHTSSLRHIRAYLLQSWHS